MSSTEFTPIHTSTVPGMRDLPADISKATEMLVTRLQKKGAAAFFCRDWSKLEALNHQNANSWFPLLPRPATAQTLWFGATDENGGVIACYGAVQIDCRARSLGEMLGDLSVFHDPGHAPTGEWCFCASDAAFQTHGMIGWMTAGWVSPAWRGRGVFHPLAHLQRFVTWAEWDVHGWAGLVDEETTSVWHSPAAGNRLLDPRPSVLYQQMTQGMPLRLPLHLCRFNRWGVSLDARMVQGYSRAA